MFRQEFKKNGELYKAETFGTIQLKLPKDILK
jgi:hypothetical protein